VLRTLNLAALAVLFTAMLAVPALAVTIQLETHRFDPLAGEPQLPADLAYGAREAGEFGYYIVQAHEPITESWKHGLQAAGANLYAYLPDMAFIVGLDAQARASVQDLAAVRWVGFFHPAYKICPLIGQHELGPQRQDDPFRTLLVQAFDDAAGVAAAIQGLGGHVAEIHDDGTMRRLLVEAPHALIPAIARLVQVWWIEERPEYRTWNNNTGWVVQSNLFGATPLWDNGINGEGQIATVMDSGVDYNSCFFRDHGEAPPGPEHRKVIDYALTGGNPYDGCSPGHGTHVAGTMAGDQSYINPGNDEHRGMAYKAKFTVQDIGPDDTWSCLIGSVSVPASLYGAFVASHELGARVHTNSWGSTSNTYDAMSVDVDRAMWDNKDFLIVFAAGNSGPGGSTVGTPGTAKNCITVGATRAAPDQHIVAGYSSRGPAADGRRKPTMMAPGGESPNFITSAQNHTGNPPSPTCNVQGSPFQGTSMATPAVAGMALNVRQYFADGYYPMGLPGGAPHAPTAALVKAVLVNSTADMGTPDIPNHNEGWGRMLMDNALYFPGDTRELIVEDVTRGLTTGETWSRAFEVDSADEPLVVTLVWTDYPGTAGSGIKLVNNLDLLVTSPTGEEYLGNVFSGGFSTTGGSHDTLNVEEGVRVNNPPLGIWTVSVLAPNVPQGPQPFALAINGAFANWPQEDGPTAVADERDEFGELAQIRITPNPVSSMTQLNYRVPAGHDGPVRLDIVDLRGRLVRSLVADSQKAGSYFVTWEGRDDAGARVADGVYFVRMQAGDQRTTAKILLVR
jgi:subtilisin family serine protease